MRERLSVRAPWSAASPVIRAPPAVHGSGGPLTGEECSAGLRCVQSSASARRRVPMARSIADRAAFVSRSGLSMTKSWMMPW
jgi:hypothetical protein